MQQKGKQNMHICFISVEIFAWGKYGGFGRATRTLGRELVKKGVEVTAIVPRRSNQKPIEILDGIRVYAFEQNDIVAQARLYRQVNADIYHSQEPSFGTFLAQVVMPNRIHLITCRDTRDANDWRIERDLPTFGRMRVIKNQIYEDNALVKWAVRHATGVFAASYLVQRKAYEHYRLGRLPQFLPTPVQIPKSVNKSGIPVVLFVARWDRRKRPEMFFELAKKFPKIKFIAVGASHDKTWDSELRSEYETLPNLEMPGMIDQFASDALSRLYSRSWILVNTAAREGLPNSFIEALAHRCAILSTVDPDEFASRFGYFAKDDDITDGLVHLLEQDRWCFLGEQGYQHVLETFDTNISVDRHLAIYNSYSTQQS